MPTKHKIKHGIPKEHNEIENLAVTPAAAAAVDPSKKKRKLSLKAAKNKNRHKDQLIIDLSDVPPQPLILKNELTCKNNGRLYNDNTRRRSVNAGSSKYTGVYYEKGSSTSKWRAQMMVNGRVRSLGHWDNEEEAAAIYARAAFKYKSKGYNGLYGGLDLSNVPEQPLIRSSTSASGYKGVKKMKGRFQARVCRKGRSATTLGTFDTAEEAAGIHARAVYHLENEGGRRSECRTADNKLQDRGGSCRVDNADATDNEKNDKRHGNNPDAVCHDRATAGGRDVKVVAV